MFWKRVQMLKALGQILPRWQNGSRNIKKLINFERLSRDVMMLLCAFKDEQPNNGSNASQFLHQINRDEPVFPDDISTSLTRKIQFYVAFFIDFADFLDNLKKYFEFQRNDQHGDI